MTAIKGRTKLINALLKAAMLLERGLIKYDTSYHEYCSAGVLFCVLLDLSPTELAAKIPEDPDTKETYREDWTDLFGMFCAPSGRTTHSLFKDILDFGLTHQDVCDLEYLTNPEVVKRMHLSYPSYKTRTETYKKFYFFTRTRTVQEPVERPRNPDSENREDVILYMRTWAGMLAEQDHAERLAVQLRTEMNAIQKADNGPADQAPDNKPDNESFGALLDRLVKAEIIKEQKEQKKQSAWEKATTPPYEQIQDTSK